MTLALFLGALYAVGGVQVAVAWRIEHRRRHRHRR
jgi:hypothetical protein